ncbi:MAG: hypothetical protein KAR20_06210 [Candidatus Heimdallarchaeota archaeon]|nr:hypothetical protein [Candidatus Heimdallarchaeota archaeon]
MSRSNPNCKCGHPKCFHDPNDDFCHHEDCPCTGFLRDQTRHVATIEVYVFGDAKQAFEEAENICGEINHKYDSQAKVYKLHEQPFATLSSKEIDISKLK